ncbi:LysR family transcriptional regulator [Spartinivicinus poritis]|uniref:LysR family transcriptional regulator n=1 Tax=Spartinivicinus poritis TaxID=2994640 RepID=A0ABT5UA88_9GAMM|nr:LysR family transcriptional regulator [Spartinivicinus sp. A2-2]MDE1463296.1 LysR family transcriptional regulator [Spartinivicinus sp. A2-2]
MLKNINLGLLQTLLILLQENHVSKAAARLNLTQSAVSRQLGQLRELFQDPLFVRQGNLLLATPRAKQLEPELKALIHQVNTLVSPVNFNPAHWQGNLTLASSDYVGQFIFPDIFEAFALQAPGLTLNYQLWQPDQLSVLGELDIEFVTTMLDQLPDGIYGELIGQDSPVCVMAKTHPLAQQKADISLSDLLSYPHISITTGGEKDSFVDTYLTSIQKQRHIQLKVPLFATAINILCRSDALLVIPEHIALHISKHFPVYYRLLPIPIPIHKYWLIWHPKYDMDQAHIWARGMLITQLKGSIYSPLQVMNNSHD